jgi:beta-galactosidase
LVAGLSLFTLLAIIVLSVFSLRTLDSQPKYTGALSEYLPIHAGEMEYSRVPAEYWEHRLRMIKAMGLNAVSVYVMWNYHELAEGEFDFEHGDRNLKGFLELAQNVGLRVLLRPGPYVCAEWDFGGLPARLLGIEGLVIRSANELYEAEVKIFFEALAPIISPFLASNGGNIILLQIENEYGYIGESNQHLLNLVQIWYDLGVDCEFYIEDPGAFWDVSYWNGAHIGLSETSSLLRYVDIELSPKRNKDSLVFGGEVYSGWFTEWGWDWGTVSTKDITDDIRSLLEYERSFSLYMVFGGTNFGVTAGANGDNGFYKYLPHITSYDYDSPISEQGRATEKYLALRELLIAHKKEGSEVP